LPLLAARESIYESRYIYLPSAAKNQEYLNSIASIARLFNSEYYREIYMFLCHVCATFISIACLDKSFYFDVTMSYNVRELVPFHPFCNSLMIPAIFIGATTLYFAASLFSGRQPVRVLRCARGAFSYLLPV